MELAQTEAGLLLLGFLFLVLALGVWIGLALMLVGLAGIVVLPLLIPGMPTFPVEKVMGTAIWQAMASWTLAALPLFIWMGEILLRTRLSEGLFRGLAPWLQRLPGRLLHTNIIGCTIFAAVSGSSAVDSRTGTASSREPLSPGSREGGTTAGSTLSPTEVLGLRNEVENLRRVMQEIRAERLEPPPEYGS